MAIISLDNNKESNNIYHNQQTEYNQYVYHQQKQQHNSILPHPNRVHFPKTSRRLPQVSYLFHGV